MCLCKLFAMDTAFCTLELTKCAIHASLGLRSLEGAEEVGRCKTSPWRHLDFWAEVDVRHGLIPLHMRIDLYSDKSDQIFSGSVWDGTTYRRSHQLFSVISPFVSERILFPSHAQLRKRHATEMGPPPSSLSNVPMASVATASFASPSSRISASKRS